MRKKILFVSILMLLIASLSAVYVEVGTGEISNSYIPTYGFYSYGWSRTIYPQSELINEMDMDMLLHLPRKLTKDGLYIAEQDNWLDDENRRIEFPRLGYYNHHLNQKRIIGNITMGYYWLQNTNPNPTENQPYLCFNEENVIRIFYSIPFYGQPILLKTP